MNTPTATTDYLLRTVAFSQHASEQLSADILRLCSRYTEIKPRLPLGGPDGGRDIEAILDGQQVVWAASGFRNSVDDGAENKRWVKRKFKLDVDRMLKENSALKAMAFFTNVYLTPAELKALEGYATSNGVQFVDIFSRQRIRLELDSIPGLVYRVRHLGIPMTLEEQNAFFDRSSTQLQSSINARFDALETHLRRVQFELDCQKPLRHIRLVLLLKEASTSTDLGHFRFMAEFQPAMSYNVHPVLHLAAESQCGGQGESLTVGMRFLVWANGPNETIDTKTGCDLGGTTSQLFAQADLLGRGPFKRLGDLQGLLMRVFVTEPLFEKIAYVGLVASDYVLRYVDAAYLEAVKGYPIGPWPEQERPDKPMPPWVCLAPRGARSMIGVFGGLWNPWDLSFRNEVPELMTYPEGFRCPPEMTIFP